MTSANNESPQLVAVVCAEKEVLELLAHTPDVRLLGVFDPAPGADTLGFQHLGDDACWDQVRARHPDLKVIIAFDVPRRKVALVAHYGPERLFSVRSPYALVSPTAQLGPGHLIQHGVKILARARVGTCVKLNADATVHHDCVVGDHCTIAPGARLLGAVALGHRVFVGASATVLPHIRVGDDCTIGAGAVVIEDVPSGTTVVGVPARAVGRRSESRQP
jgi:sugar O-acyltransferase (sialic acid O-acetyltransferase NeuD family)